MKIQKFLLICFTIPMLSACGDVFSFKVATAGLAAATHGVFSNPDVNLKEKSYAAADFLYQDLKKSKIRKDTLDIPYARKIEFHPLVELDNPAITSDFGFEVSEWVGRRFTELGFDTYLEKVSPEKNKDLYTSPEQFEQVDLKLNGTYAVRDKHIDVMLRIFDVNKEELVANFDYAIPLNREIRNMAKTDARIFKVNSSAKPLK